MDNLKPCPFCGGEAAIIEAVDGVRFVAGCLHCGIELPFLYDTNEEAIEAWNTRKGEGE